MSDDITQALEDIRQRGDKLLDEFTDLLLNTDDLITLLPELEELKHRQDDVLAALDAMKKK